MKILNQSFNQDEFRNYVATYDFGRVKPDSLVIHHTWKPTQKDWRGEKSIMGLKNYYEGLGWSAGPHLFIGSDKIYTFTPMNEVGIHAGKGNSHRDKLGRLVGYSIGIEVVGDYDTEHWSGHTKNNALHVIRVLMEKLNIDTEHVTFHKDWMPQKSCPGHAITKEWLFKELVSRETSQDISILSKWAQDGWAWQIEQDFDRQVNPHTRVEAEWIFAILKKFHDKFNQK